MSRKATVDIASLAHGGFGVARVEGQVCFVAHGLPGDVADVTIAREAKGVLWARIDRVVTPSPHRTAPPCPVFGVCGGCEWLHFAYPAQGEWKRRIVADCFRRIAKIDVEPGWAEDESLRLGYRTRAEFHGSDGTWGFYERESHRVAKLDACPLCHPKLNEAYAALRAVPLDASVELTVNPDGDDVLVWSKREYTPLREAFPGYNSVHDGTSRHLFSFDGVPIVNGAFSQGSLLLNRVLRREVDPLVDPTGHILDLYCGSGNFSMPFLGRASVTACDVNAAAIEAASAVAPESYTVQPEERFPDLITARPWDTIILDPPRTGARAVIPALAGCQASRLVYVSCDPATLSRDVAGLASGGWQLDRCTVVDMFPQTSHLEIVCRLSR